MTIKTPGHFTPGEETDRPRTRQPHQQPAIPTPAECEAVHQAFTTSEDIRRHCRKVAEAAECLGRALNEAGRTLDIKLIMAGALLHDLAKSEKNHAAVGAKWLEDMGLHHIAAIVAQHSDMDVPENAPVSEAEVVYLADKLVRGGSMSTLDRRYQASMEKYGDREDIRQKIQARWKRAEKSQRRMERVLNRSLSDLLPPPVDQNGAAS